MQPKTLHKVVSSLSFRAGYDNPQTLYREVYNEMKIEKEGNKSRIKSVMRQSRFTEFLGLVLSKTRKSTMLNDQIQYDEPFTHKLNGLRHYKFGDNNYPSVTTILKHGDDKTFDPFAAWEQKLIAEHGEKKGMRKRNIASTIGDYVHSILETYLMTGMKDKSIIDRTLAMHLIPFLDDVKRVIGVELPVYSDRGYAGRIDAVLEMKDGKTYIVDFKTSKQKRTKSNTKIYKAQAAAYALALYERTGIKVDGILLAVVYKSKLGVRNPVRHSIIIEEEIRPHLDKFLECLDAFNSKEEELGLDQAF